MKRPTSVLLGSQRGSITVLIAMMIPVFLLTIIMVINVGQLVFEKIRLQHAADASALAAGSVQSMGMNEMAHLNRHALAEYVKLRVILASGIWHTRNEGLKVVRFFNDRVLRSIHLYQKLANRLCALWANQAAMVTMVQNQPKDRVWKPKSEFDATLIQRTVVKRTAGFYYVAASSPKSPWIITKKWSDFGAGDPRRVGPHDGSYSARGVVSIGYTARLVDVRWKKVPKLTRFTFYLKQIPAPYALASGFFGNMPELSVIAKVRPTQGHIYAMQPNYQPSMNTP